MIWNGKNLRRNIIWNKGVRMSEKRFFRIGYDEEWYLFDSTTISEQLVKEQAEYGYGVFANSLSPSEIVDLLNELFEHNLHLQRLIESLAKVTGEPIEDTIARYQDKKEIYTTSKRPMRFVGGRKI